jgi:hypothetical protein
VPGSLIDLRASNASLIIFIWRARSNGFPLVCPSGKFMKTDLGGLTDSVISRAELNEMVGIPPSSTALAISPTDWWHSGQAGTRKKTSTCCSFNLLSICGASSFLRAVRRKMRPMMV